MNQKEEKIMNEMERAKKDQTQKLEENITLLKNKIKTMENEIENLKEEIKNFKQKDSDEKEKLKKNIFNINSSLFLDENASLFNQFEGKTQVSLIKEMKSIENNDLINKIDALLSYLPKEVNAQKEQYKKTNYIAIHVKETDKQMESKITIMSNMTNLLFENKSLDSVEFNLHVQIFSKICIEIDYPSPYFEDIYQTVLNLKKSHENKLEICIFMNGIEATDQYFQGNREIGVLKFDSYLKKIANIDSKGSFEGCESLTQITIPSSVTSIENCSFKGCKSLSQIEFPATINQISGSLLRDCISLTYVVIPSSVKQINDYAFFCCKSLEHILIPSSVAYIGNFAFGDCSKLTSLTIDHYRIVFQTNSFCNCVSLNHLIISTSNSLINEKSC